MRRLVLMICVLVLFGAAPSSAQEPETPETVGIRILDVPTSRTDDPRARQYIVDHVAPGTTITRRVEVSNDTGQPQEVQLYAGSASIADGSVRFGDRGATSELTGWTTVEPASVSLTAGEKTLATVNIAVPSDAGPGERYGVVWAELPPAVPPGGGVTAVNRVGVRIYLSVGPGNEPASDFTITALEARRAADGRPLLAATVRNTGGRAIDLSGDVRLSNGPGGLSAGPFPANLGTTLGLEQEAQVLVALDPAIPRGPWDAHIVLRSGTTEKDATANVTFPEAAATSAEPVKADSDSGGSGIPPYVLGGGALLLALLLLLLLLRRRRREPVEPDGTSQG
jgi:MYXO-CTERM domain-containing protein